MENTSLTPIQDKISQALESMKERSLITEANLAKKVRFIANIEGKNKAGIGLEDLEKAMEYLATENKVVYSVTLNSANEFLIKQDTEFKRLKDDARKRRQSSERGKSILTSSDLNEKKDTKKSKALKENKKLRTKTEKINIYSNFENLE